MTDRSEPADPRFLEAIGHAVSARGQAHAAMKEAEAGKDPFLFTEWFVEYAQCTGWLEGLVEGANLAFGTEWNGPFPGHDRLGALKSRLGDLIAAEARLADKLRGRLSRAQGRSAAEVAEASGEDILHYYSHIITRLNNEVAEVEEWLHAEGEKDAEADAARDEAYGSPL